MKVLFFFGVTCLTVLKATVTSQQIAASNLLPNGDGPARGDGPPRVDFANVPSPPTDARQLPSSNPHVDYKPPKRTLDDAKKDISETTNDRKPVNEAAEDFHYSFEPSPECSDFQLRQCPHYDTNPCDQGETLKIRPGNCCPQCVPEHCTESDLGKCVVYEPNKNPCQAGHVLKRSTGKCCEECVKEKHCEQFSCPKLNPENEKETPICGRDGLVYARRCEVDLYACTTRKAQLIDNKCNDTAAFVRAYSKPTCTPCYESSLKVPVCGYDNKTYTSMCEFVYESCTNGDYMINVQHTGACQSTPSLQDEEGNNKKYSKEEVADWVDSINKGQRNNNNDNEATISSNDANDNGLSTGAIVGIVLGSVTAALIVAALVVYTVMRSSTNNDSHVPLEEGKLGQNTQPLQNSLSNEAVLKSKTTKVDGQTYRQFS